MLAPGVLGRMGTRVRVTPQTMQSSSSVCNEEVISTATRWRDLALRALRRMYLPEQCLFAFRLSRGKEGRDGQDKLEGVSWRYTAIVLLALADEGREVAKEVLHGRTRAEVCDRLIMHAWDSMDLGEVALTLWAARKLGHARTGDMHERLRQWEPHRVPCPTVELAWTLAALTTPGDGQTDSSLADAIAARLLGSQSTPSDLFSHWTPRGQGGSSWRRHVCCFADMVYPILALSHYHRLTGNAQAKEAVRRCVDRMCGLQGPAGQWWWHYDVRTGHVIEPYPVYAVHQDAMGPMALLAAHDCCDVPVDEAVRKSVAWLAYAPEIETSLVDSSADVIWRKVCRREPGKLSRGIQALASGVHSGLRVPWLDSLFPPCEVDYESRPYHMGWILYTWKRSVMSHPGGFSS